MCKSFLSSKSRMTNPAKSKFVSITSQSTELGDYLRKINNYQNLDEVREKELARRVKLGDLNAKQELIEANLKLVLTIARKAIHVSRIPLIDLIQEGNVGLMLAVEKFNPELGYRFSTYATWWIKQAMFKAISEQSYCMKIPVYIQETLSKFSKVKTELERKNNTTVSNQEVAKKMDIEPEKIDTYLSAYSPTVSIEGSFDANNGSELSVADVVSDSSVSVEDNVELEELKKEISNVVSTLKEREQTVIKMRFGLEEFTKTTLEDIGKMFGVTKECIRQTEARALNKLKSSFDKNVWGFAS